MDTGKWTFKKLTKPKPHSLYAHLASINAKECRLGYKRPSDIPTYLDEIVFSSTFVEKHLELLRAVFKSLGKQNLKLRCDFFEGSVIRVDSARTDTERDWYLECEWVWCHMLSLWGFLLWFLTVTCSCCPNVYFGSLIMWVTHFS